MKIADHKRGPSEFAAQLRERLEALKTRPEMRIDFVKEMQRFLPPATVRGTIETTAYWDYLTGVLQELGNRFLLTQVGFPTNFPHGQSG